MTYPWLTGAAMLSSQDPATGNAESAATLYPRRGLGNREQAQTSAYYGQNYGTQPRAAEPSYNSDEYVKQQGHAKLLAELVHYMLVKMEPTDRCLRPPGDYYTVADMERDAEEARQRCEKRKSEGLASGE